MADDMVTVGQFMDITEAEMKRGILQTEGIDAVVADDISAFAIAAPVAAVCIRLQVPASQVQQAVEILEHLDEDFFS